MASRTGQSERQPLLDRREADAHNEGEGHYNLAGLSSRHFWILVNSPLTSSTNRDNRLVIIDMDRLFPLGIRYHRR